MTITSTFQWIKSIFSETDGSGSCSRLCITAIVFFVIGIGTSFAFKMHSPFTMSDYCSFLSSAGMFIATTCSPLYLINKGADAISKNTAALNSTPNPPTGV